MSIYRKWMMAGSAAWFIVSMLGVLVIVKVVDGASDLALYGRCALIVVGVACYCIGLSKHPIKKPESPAGGE